MGFKHENRQTFIFTVNEGMHHSNTPIYEFKNMKPVSVNMKSLLCKIPNYTLHEWVAFN